MNDVRASGFREVVRLSEARKRLRKAVSPIERTEQVPVTRAAGRVVAAPVRAGRSVPHYRRAAMDGYAVRAEDTFGASGRAPEVLRESDGTVGAGEAVRVHTGSALPEGADAVVKVEHADSVSGDLEVFTAVAAEDNVAPIGEDVGADQLLYEAGHRLRPSDLGLLRAAGVTTVEIYDRPTVGVVPTGDEVVETDPAPGEVVETNGLTVTRYCRRWGGTATHRDVVPDDREALRAAVERDLTKDLLVTTGGSSVGDRDLVPEVVADLGEVFVHGVALKPGHPVGLGRVHDTPVLLLPGYPVACIVNAVQFLRPAVKWTGHLTLEPLPTTEAQLTRKVTSEPGTRSFVRVTLDRTGSEPTATPTRASGAGVLSSVALADGWIVVEESREGIASGETVAVQDWERYS